MLFILPMKLAWWIGLKFVLKDAKKAAAAILEDPNNGGRAVHLANRKEQSALRLVLKCIEEYKLEAEFPPENLKKRLEQLEKTKTDKKRATAVAVNKRTRVCNNGPMPPAKAGCLTNAYVSSFPLTFIRSPSHIQYTAGVARYSHERFAPAMYGSSNPLNSYSPESAPAMAGPHTGPPVSYPAYDGYSNGMASSYPRFTADR